MSIKQAQERRRMTKVKKVTAGKNVQQLLNEKGITTGPQALQLLMGKTVVMSNAVGGYKAGDKVKIDMSGGWQAAPACAAGQNGYIYHGGSAAFYFSNMSISVQTKEGLEAEMVENENSIKELMAENESIKLKIEFIAANSLEEYDDELFKVYEVLKQLDNKKLTGIERAKVIAKIIKNS